MTVKELIQKTGWTLHASEEASNREVQGAFVGDLLSWVMGNGDVDQAWLTVQAHLNVVAVAVLREFSCVILVHGVQPSDDMIEKTIEENLAIISTTESAYEACKTLISLGV